MTKILYKINPWNAIYFADNDGDDEISDQHVLEFRDSIRDALDPQREGLHWTVSDIVKWQGSGTRVDYRGRAFVIQHRDGTGELTGHEWLFICIPHSARYVLGGNTTISVSETILSSYWRTEANDTIDIASSTVSNKGRIYFHYNDTADTTPYGMGLNADGSHPDGDFGEPEFSPWSGLEDFMPQGKLMGLICSNNFRSNYHRSLIRLLIDWEKPYIALYATQGKHNYVRTVYLTGNVVVPYRSDDTYTNAAIWWDLSVNATSQGNPSSENSYVYDHHGQVVLQDLMFYKHFTTENTPLDDGKYPWDVVSLGTDAYYKGYIDSDIVRVMGPDNEKYLSLYDGGNFIKYHRHLCFPYEPNKVVFPPGE